MGTNRIRLKNQNPLSFIFTNQREALISILKMFFIQKIKMIRTRRASNMNSASNEAKKELLEKIKTGDISDKKELEQEKRKTSKKYNLSRVPSNAEILEIAEEDEKDKVLPILRRKPVRSISGVSVITVMPKPHSCPKDEPCIYCPGGPDQDTPQSYTGEEPASARAKKADYDPVKQIETRKNQMRAIGHTVDKVELIIFGGTFLDQPIDYQEDFIHSCIDTISENDSSDLESAKKNAETSDTKIVGINFETRPDYCKEEHVDRMLRFGGTRVEIGVQTVYQDIYDKIRREHTLDDVIKATKTAKDAGLATLYHMMPGLPGSNPEKDLEAFETIFEDSRFRPDMIKIYPCLVMEDTELYDLWKKGEYEPLEGKEAVNLVAEMKEKVPEWVRIQRVQRDIPAGLIKAGVWRGNFRNIVKEKLEKENKNCRCIRCREVGHKMLKENVEPKIEEAELLTQKYEASEGKEIFISIEDRKKDLIFGHCRMRLPSSNPHRARVDNKTSLIRMLYVFGELVSVGNESSERKWQHKGFGEKMLKKAEKIASEEYDSEKMSILSGIGTRSYYRKFNYELDGPYMVKNL